MSRIWLLIRSGKLRVSPMETVTSTSGSLETRTFSAASLATARSGLGRVESIDILRGIVMVIMALDHTRDFFTNLSYEPELLAKTYYGLFFTRWITHFCAPLFFFLAGTGAFLYGRRHTSAELTRFLWTRGLWLILLEFTVVGTSWTFLFPWGFFGVIWALGGCMVVIALGVRLPVRWLALLSLLVIATHDLFDRVRPQQFGSFAWVWGVLHVRGGITLPFQLHEFVLFPFIPLVGVMAAGYCFGTLYLLEERHRKKLLKRAGIALVVTFCLLRFTNLYGNPSVAVGGVSQGDWHVQSTFEKTLVLFLDVEKYPMSLQFLLMTLGPALLFLARLDKNDNPQKTSALRHALLIFGRVPLFYYVLHLYLIHGLAILLAVLFRQPVTWLFHGAIFGDTPAGYGHGLLFIYLVWITAIVILYFPCRWWAGLKQRRKAWWLSYL